jgi:hypothetical protein
LSFSRHSQLNGSYLINELETGDPTLRRIQVVRWKAMLDILAASMVGCQHVMNNYQTNILGRYTGVKM